MSWTGDPIADFDHYDREQQQELDRLPKCSYCGEPIQGDYAFVFDGKCICEECVNEWHRVDVENLIQ